MSTLEELVAVGEKIQLTGKDLQAFIATQQEAQREERRQNREAEKLEAERVRLEAERERQAAETARERERQEAETARERERQEAEKARERERQEEETTRERERHRYEQEALEAAQCREIELLEVRSRLKVQDEEEGEEEGNEEGWRFNRTKTTPAKLDVPKFDNKQIRTVAKYLDLFEGVVKQNGYEKEVWPLALRTAMAGTKLETIAAIGGSYDEIKQEILLAYDQTPEQIWHDLIQVKQGEESFRQLCVRVGLKVAQFFDLARKPAEHAQDKPDLTVDDTIEILVKYLILEGCTPELRTHFLERKVRTLDVEEFQELGVAFQAAHGRAKHVDFSADRKKFGSASHEDDSSTMLAWKVEVKREAAELGKFTKCH